MSDNNELKKRIVGILEVIAAYPRRHNFDSQDAEICTAGIDLIASLEKQIEASREFVVELPKRYECDCDCGMIAFEDGDYVKFDEVKAAIEAAGGRVK